MKKRGQHFQQLWWDTRVCISVFKALTDPGVYSAQTLSTIAHGTVLCGKEASYLEMATAVTAAGSLLSLRSNAVCMVSLLRNIS